MEESEKELIRKLSGSNTALKRLYDEHVALDSKVSALEGQHFLTAQEQSELKELKRRKLAGVDKIMQILTEHRTLAQA